MFENLENLVFSSTFYPFLSQFNIESDCMQPVRVLLRRSQCFSEDSRQLWAYCDMSATEQVVEAAAE